MILTAFLILLNIILIGMMIFIILAFRREKADEKIIHDQIDTIKHVYEERMKQNDEQLKAAEAKMQEAEKRASELEEAAKQTTDACDVKITAMQTQMEQKIEELNTLEATMRAEAGEKIKEFEKEQREEVEKNMVSLVMNVSKKVLEKTFSYEEHKALIKRSLDDMKFDE